MFFRREGDGTEIVLTPDNAAKIVVEKFDKYLAFSGVRMTNPISLNEAPLADYPDVYDSVKTFLREIAATSIYSFYIFDDALRTNFFYAGKDGKIIDY